MGITTTIPTNLNFPNRGELERDDFVLAQETAQDLLAGSYTTALNQYATQLNSTQTDINAKWNDVKNQAVDGGYSQDYINGNFYNKIEADGFAVKLTGDQTIAGVKNFTSNPTINNSLIYARSNILGTVSQSGGVPTGAVIERGSNVNGRFVKYADGTLICMQEWGVSLAISTSSFGGFRSVAQTWTYPASFVGGSGEIYPFANTKRVGSGFGAGCTGETASAVEWIVTAITSTAASTRYVATMAIGRWY
jgi:hypothetical protein